VKTPEKKAVEKTPVKTAEKKAVEKKEVKTAEKKKEKKAKKEKSPEKVIKQPTLLLFSYPLLLLALPSHPNYHRR
jgi:hypothetical protein